MPSPSLVPDLDCDGSIPSDQVIDTDHLTRMTFGEERLRREVLALFDRQATRLAAQLHQSREVAEAAHALAGAASAIGAMVVAEAATELERTVKSGRDPHAAVVAVESAIDEARKAIADMLDAR